MNRKACLTLAICLASTAASHAAPTPQRASKAPADASGEAAEELKTDAPDKKRFEAYLKERVGKVAEHHKARMDFFAKEADTWNSFWTKVRDDRKLFEIRATRQTMNLFESLASLDPRDHPATISDFDKMHGNVIKAFELQQKQKMAEFFSAREARWRAYAADQERERSDFAAMAMSDWQNNKAGLRSPAGTMEGQGSFQR